MSKKKIGILTLYYNNHNMGGLLQAYALQTALGKLGYDAELISYRFLKEVVAPKNDIVRKIVRKIKTYKINKDFVQRKKAFGDFMNHIPHSTQVYGSDKEFVSCYDGIVVGSDQVWGDWLSKEALDCFLLKGITEHKKKYSYAASIGSDKINTSLSEVYKKGLGHFAHISVREESAKAEIEKLLPDADISVDLDPTLLLTPQEWTAVAKEKYAGKKYIFCYFLGKDASYREAAKKVAEKMGLPIVTMPYVKENRREAFEDDFGTYNDYASGPAEFIGIIKNAELVITDSFHAVVFSSQFHKNFYALARKIEGEGSTNRRILDFLERFELRDRFVDVDQLNEVDFAKNVDFSRYENMIGDLRVQSLNYLQLL